MSAKGIISDFTHSCSDLSWCMLIICKEPVWWTLASLSTLSSDLRDMWSELNRICTACWVAGSSPFTCSPLFGWQPVSLYSCNTCIVRYIQGSPALLQQHPALVSYGFLQQKIVYCCPLCMSLKVQCTWMLHLENGDVRVTYGFSSTNSVGTIISN